MLGTTGKEGTLIRDVFLRTPTQGRISVGRLEEFTITSSVQTLGAA